MILVLSFYQPSSGDDPIHQDETPSKVSLFKEWYVGKLITHYTSLALLQIILCSLVLDLFLSWMYLSSLAGALMCDCLTAAASRPWDSGVQGAWNRDKKESFI